MARGAEPTDLVDPKALLESVPREMLKDSDEKSRNRVEAMDAATQKLRDSLKDKTGTVSFTIKYLNKSNGRYSVSSSSERLRSAGTNFNFGYTVFFDEAQNEKMAKMKVGDKVTATGKLFASIYGTQSPYFRIELSNAKLK